MNYDFTVKCVDEEFCGPGYRNATRRARVWLSSSLSKPLFSFGEMDINAYLIIWVLFFGCLSLVSLQALLWGIERVFDARHAIRQSASDLYDRFFNVREVARLRAALAAERARADHLAVELATVRGMNHMCTALAHRVGAYNDDDG